MGVGWKLLRHLFLLRWEKKIYQWNFTEKVTRIPFINVTIFQLMTSLDHFWWVNKFRTSSDPEQPETHHSVILKSFIAPMFYKRKIWIFFIFLLLFFQFKISAFTYLLHSCFFWWKKSTFSERFVKVFLNIFDISFVQKVVDILSFCFNSTCS